MHFGKRRNIGASPITARHSNEFDRHIGMLCEFDRHIGMLCEFDMHIGMLSSSREFDRHIGVLS